MMGFSDMHDPGWTGPNAAPPRMSMVETPPAPAAGPSQQNGYLRPGQPLLARAAKGGRFPPREPPPPPPHA